MGLTSFWSCPRFYVLSELFSNAKRSDENWRRHTGHKHFPQRAYMYENLWWKLQHIEAKPLTLDKMIRHGTILFCQTFWYLQNKIQVSWRSDKPWRRYAGHKLLVPGSQGNQSSKEICLKCMSLIPHQWHALDRIWLRFANQLKRYCSSEIADDRQQTTENSCHPVSSLGAFASAEKQKKRKGISIKFLKLLTIQHVHVMARLYVT